jgi:outer membrane protein OmpA-like peptidoglycan-associated protein
MQFIILNHVIAHMFWLTRFLASIALTFLVFQGKAQFIQVCNQILKNELDAENYEYYKKHFRKRKHLEQLSEVVIAGKLVSEARNNLAMMPGEISSYAIGENHLVVVELAQPVGGTFKLNLYDENWQVLDSFILAAHYNMPSYHFSLAPDSSVLLVVESEKYHSVYNHECLTILQIANDSFQLSFQEYTYFDDHLDTIKGIENANVILEKTGLILNRIEYKRQGFYGNSVMANSGVYNWKNDTKKFALAQLDDKFQVLLTDTTLELPIAFDLARWEIRPDAAIVLDSLADFLVRNPDVEIEIGNHLDARISNMCCSRLDGKRAESVCSYLNSKGVEEARLKAKGYGKKYPLVTWDEIEKLGTDEEEIEKAHAKNRRTMVKVIKRANYYAPEYYNPFTQFSFDTLLTIPELLLPVQFDLAKYDVKDEYKPMLDSLAAFLIRNPNIEIEIGNHLDTRWNDMYSNSPDQRRAGNIVDYLVQKGANKNQLLAMGYADYKPIHTEQEIAKMKTEEEKEAAEKENRRTVITVLKN